MTPPYDPDSDERDKPNWREIDRKRDRSRHVSREKSSRKEKSLRSTWAKQQYLKEVDKFFQGERGGKEHKVALDAIHRHYGTAKFAPAVRKYLKKYGIPVLKEKSPERSPVERQAFKDKLEILSFTASSSQITSFVEKTLSEL